MPTKTLDEKLAAMTGAELSAVEVVALAKCVTDKQLTAARAEVSENSAHEVDFTVRVRGSVQRGSGSPEVTSLVPACVNLSRLDVFCHVLKSVGIGPQRLRTALLDVATQERIAPLTPLPKFADAFASVANDLAAKLPAVPRTTPGRAGNISAQTTVAKL